MYEVLGETSSHGLVSPRVVDRTGHLWIGLSAGRQVEQSQGNTKKRKHENKLWFHEQPKLSGLL